VGSRKSGIAPVSSGVFGRKQFGDRSIAVVEAIERRVLIQRDLLWLLQTKDDNVDTPKVNTDLVRDLPKQRRK